MSEYYCPACMGLHAEKECPLVDELRGEIECLREQVRELTSIWELKKCKCSHYHCPICGNQLRIKDE